MQEDLALAPPRPLIGAVRKLATGQVRLVSCGDHHSTANRLLFASTRIPGMEGLEKASMGSYLACTTLYAVRRGGTYHILVTTPAGPTATV